MKAGPGAEAGAAVAEDVPGQSNARLGQEERTVVVDAVGLDAGCGGEDTVDGKVDAGATLRLAPAGGGFAAEAGADFDTRG